MDGARGSLVGKVLSYSSRKFDQGSRLCFFFQAEDGIRDHCVTGVQTCALPIFGVLYKGWVGDACVTFAVGKLDTESQRLMDVAQRCLELGIEQARPNKQLGDVGAAIQTYAESQGFSTVREYVGHGVGHSLHEDPQVPHYGLLGTGLRLRPGMVFTIEPMINAGGYQTRVLADKWTVCTADGSRSAQFEHCIAITDGAPELLTLP